MDDWILLYENKKPRPRGKERGFFSGQTLLSVRASTLHKRMLPVKSITMKNTTIQHPIALFCSQKVDI